MYTLIHAFLHAHRHQQPCAGHGRPGSWGSDWAYHSQARIIGGEGKGRRNGAAEGGGWIGGRSEGLGMPASTCKQILYFASGFGRHPLFAKRGNPTETVLTRPPTASPAVGPSGWRPCEANTLDAISSFWRWWMRHCCSKETSPMQLGGHVGS